jgi:hypothetical protein
MKNETLYKIKSIATAVTFILAIYISFLTGVFQEDKTISTIEKRSLKVKPSAPRSLSDIQIFPQLFDEYYSDHFGLRDWLAGHYKLAKYKIGDSSSHEVTLGKDGWLFLGSLKSTANNDPIGDYRNINLYSQEELKQFAQYVMHTKNWLNEQGIEYIFVIAPNKHTIYSEYLPDYIQKNNDQSAMDQLLDHLKENTSVVAVDLREPLISAKEQHSVYYKTDTHWNHYGANIAQYKIMLAIEELFPGSIHPELYQMQVTTKGGGDLAGFLGLNIFEEEEPQPVFQDLCQPTTSPLDLSQSLSHAPTCESQSLSVLVFGDSFFDALEPYFSRKFKNATYLNKQLDYETLTKQVLLNNPDIVIEEIVERKLPYVPVLPDQL